ncbi:MAG: DUF6438 domain-containing protein [Bacteroidota bacterium]
MIRQAPAPILLLMLVVLCVSSSCNRKASQDLTPPKVRTPKPDPVIDHQEVKEVEQQEPEIEALEEVIYLVASIRKTGCYGHCPSFEIRLFSDGRLTYKGYAYVEKMGLYEAWAEDSLRKKLRHLVGSYQYFNFADQYPPDGSQIADLPSTYTHINLDGLQKYITNHFDSPKALRAFEEELQLLLENRNWKKLMGNESQ